MKKMDGFAAEMIPIRLVISMVIIAAIMVMVVMGYNYFRVVSAEHQVENEYRAFESTLYSMIGSGVARDVNEVGAGEGTKRVFTFHLPDTLVYLAFGVDPDTDNDGVLHTGLTEGGSVVCYRVSNGGKHVFWLPSDQFQFREGNYTDERWVIHEDGQGFILDAGGESTLTFELVQQNTQVYILIQGSDSFNP
ncbi:MAG: hypothetical protein V1726_04090 [Methanobacteriota archaeon]